MFGTTTIRRCVATLCLGIFAAGVAFADPVAGPGLSPDEALQKLMDGNKRYVENKLTDVAMIDSATRISLAKSRNPTQSS